MLEGPGRRQREARVSRAFRFAGRRDPICRLTWRAGRGLRNIGLVGLGCALGGGVVLLASGARALEVMSPISGVYYASCRDALLDGASSIRRGEPGYRLPLDADHDGVACEPYRGP